jgi:DNA-binding NarL/FixJ family response regulator
MAGHLPTLDSAALARLRRLVGVMHERNGRALPMSELVQLAGAAKLGAAVTVDFQASRELGEPMIVLRVGEVLPPLPSLAALSSRERQIAVLIGGGLANKQIARRLHITLATVKDHVHNILRKTGLPNRAAIAAAAKSSAPTQVGLPP